MKPALQNGDLRMGSASSKVKIAEAIFNSSTNINFQSKKIWTKHKRKISLNEKCNDESRSQ
jgi:hypothetical protein